MFAIEWVKLTDFKSFMGEHTIEFPHSFGLYYLTGKNLLNPRLGANACGKSTILDAVHWAIYGRTARGLKSGDVVGWHAKSCSVALLLTVGPHKITLQRSQSPNSLTIDGKPTDQVHVNKLVRMGETAFDYAVMLPQFGTSFFDLAPTAKLNFFTEVLELDLWLEKSAEAAKLTAEIIEAKQANETRLAGITGVITAHKNDITELQAKEVAFAQEKANALKAAKLERASVEQELGKYKKQLGQIIGCLAGADVRIKRLETDLEAGANIDAQCGSLCREDQIIRLELVELEAIGPKCPLCSQKVDKSHLVAEQIKRKKRLGEITTELAQLRKKLEARKQMDIDLVSIKKNHADFTGQQAQTKTVIAQLEGKITAITGRINTEANRPNPYSDLVQTKRAALTALSNQAATLKASIRQLEQEHTAVSYWVAGFKRVRLMIVEETLRQLEIEVNNNLASLGLLDWHIQFDVERETKAGGISKGFVVFVYAPDRAEPVKFEAWSGGEVQRLRMAGDLGVANLIMERTGLTNTIEFYDEPSSHLSEDGLRDLLDTLQQRATADEKTIFIVDHHSIDYGSFDGTLTVVKDENGSHLEA